MKHAGIVVVTLAFVCVMATGSIGVSGDVAQYRVPTLGSELMDLHEAYGEGAIDQKEYERQKDQLLEKGRPCPERCP